MKERDVIASGLFVILVAAVTIILLWNNDGSGDGDIPDGEDNSDVFGDLYAATVGGAMALVSSQTASAQCFDLVKQQENCRLTAYFDVNGYSIGWGHHGVAEGTVWTQEQADSQLSADVSSACNTVLSYARGSLTQNQLDALTDWMYEFGASKTKSSTIWGLIASGNYAGVPAVLMQWVNSGGQQSDALVQRRQAECDLWNGASA